MTSAATRQILRDFGAALLLLALAAVALVVHFTRMARPPVRPQRDADGVRAPREAVFDALSPDAVCRTFSEIDAFGSRAPGQPGLERTADYIIGRFKSLGLETYTQDVDVPYPLLAEGSGFVSNGLFRSAVWPLAPNYAQTSTTGPDGIDGELFVADATSMRSAEDFAGRIAVIDVGGDVFGDFGLNPARYAALGFSAIIYTHHDGLEAADWEAVARYAVLSRLPVNIVRLACSPRILAHDGERVHIDAVSTWRNAKTRNIVGVLRAPNSEGRALVIPVQYDAASVLPDVAHGSLEAFQAATLVQTAEALSAIRDHLKRDIVFAATTGLSQNHSGANRLLSTIGLLYRRAQPRSRLDGDVARNESRLAMIDEILAMLAGRDGPILSGGGGVAPRQHRDLPAAVRALPKATQKFLAERFGAAMRDLVFAQAEDLLAAQIAYERHPDDLGSSDFRAYRREKAIHDRLTSLSGLPFAKAIALGRDGHGGSGLSSGAQDLMAVFRDSLMRLRDYHLERRRALADDAALVDLFSGYSDICAVSPRFSPISSAVGERLGIATGRDIQNGESYNLFKALTQEAILRLGPDAPPELAENGWNAFSQLFSAELDSLPFCAASYPAFSLVSATSPAHHSRHPFAQPDFADAAIAPAQSLRVFADVCASIAETSISYPRLHACFPFAVHGSVFAAGVGNSAIPNYPVAGAFICSCDRKQFVFTDPYGEYDLPFVLVPMLEFERWESYDAFLFDAHGRVTYAKDYGSSAQSLYKSIGMIFNYQPLCHVLYRASPVAILDIVNPQSLKAFSAFSFLGTKGLASFSSTCPYSTGDGFMDFLPPNARFFVTLKAGAPENELVAVTRAFCLGTTAMNDPSWKPSENEIDGPGYLAADMPVFGAVASESVASMTWLTDKRLALQRRYGIADELTDAFAAKAAETALAAEAALARSPASPDSHESRQRDLKDLKDLKDFRDLMDGAPAPALSRLRRQREALSYLILNHPVVRSGISEAVFGIIWYLGLLVPFAFFFEKLLFAFTDARKQLLAQGVIFLTVFIILRLLHPAFHMIRSSAMILLGFVIMVIVGSVLALLSGKFQENIDALRRAQGHVAGADGNKGGIILTAFMLGLNNMHRRRVRTGLTCATLVLMTFVMVCFTSVQSGIVDSERAVGHAAYQGIILREKEFMPISGAEIDALKSEFGERHSVSRRTIFTGFYDSGAQVMRPAAFRVAAGIGDASRQRVARGALGFDPEEPLAASIRLLCTNGWFAAGEGRTVMLSDLMASQLGITPELVEAGDSQVTVNGISFTVRNIFDAESLAAAADADGHDLLPFDVETLAATRFGPGQVLLADDATPRIPATDIILVANNTLSADYRGVRTSSAVIDMGGTPYPVARAEIVSHMERSGRECHYALDGTAFAGQRARARSATGYIELLIPLVIAALTVLNTMKGSVYERQSEIYVYNAVGIAPRYIFFIFMAESLVYAVVGAVLGYVFSLGAGRLVAHLGATGGADMNFTSATCVYASLAIAAATLLSTFYPARAAMRIAKPADNAGWTLPPPDADGRLSILLPFTFTHYDRIAVLAFFLRYFEGFGEGGAGPFFASEPELGVSDHLDDLADGAYIPNIVVRIWLKPFDLGVSQLLEIEFPTDPDTKEYVARMVLTRLTGTRDAWLRLNGPFVTALRRRFLHWRAVTPEQKTDLFAVAQDILKREAAHGMVDSTGDAKAVRQDGRKGQQA